jgi:transcription initiation factor TFIID TATA-box-binding protein
MPTIQNVVASAEIGESLNLNAVAIALGLENVEYEPEQFPGLVYRLTEPDTVVLLFGSGKMVCTGATSRDEVQASVHRVTEDLESYGFL